MIRSYICLFIIVCMTGSVTAQSFGFNLPGKEKVDIPFEFQGKFIVINVTFERLFPLRFIFDTGAEHTILTKREVADLLQIRYDRKISIMGADMMTELYADIARRIRLDLPGVDMLQDILVLGDDYFHLDEVLGEQIHGILGASLFRNYVVKINYNQQIITLYDPAHFKEPVRKYTRFEMEVDRNKPYVRAGLKLRGDSIIQTRLLMDTGAGLSLMLYSNNMHGMHLPQNIVKANIGRGLGGNLEGYVGRVPYFDFCGYGFSNIIANFQDVSELPDSTLYADKQGIIGNDILSRFNLILDFPGDKLYLYPNRHFKTRYLYDKSGLSLIAAGVSLNKILVSFVLEGSPGHESGILPGDEIISINGTPTAIIRLSGTLLRLQGKTGKKMHLKIRREGIKIHKELILRELI